MNARTSIIGYYIPNAEPRPIPYMPDYEFGGRRFESFRARSCVTFRANRTAFAREYTWKRGTCAADFEPVRLPSVHLDLIQKCARIRDAFAWHLDTP